MAPFSCKPVFREDNTMHLVHPEKTDLASVSMIFFFFRAVLLLLVLLCTKQLNLFSSQVSSFNIRSKHFAVYFIQLRPSASVIHIEALSAASVASELTLQEALIKKVYI